MSRRFAGRHRAQLGDLSMAPGISDGSRLAVERSGRSVLDRACKIRERSRLEDRHRNASWICGLQSRDDAEVALDRRLAGVLDTKPYTDERARSWIFRTCGFGHGAEWWSEFISTLRMFGYDYVLSIEHEDSLLSAEEGLTKAANFLNEIVIRERPSAAWWL